MRSRYLSASASSGIPPCCSVLASRSVRALCWPRGGGSRGGEVSLSPVVLSIGLCVGFTVKDFCPERLSSQNYLQYRVFTTGEEAHRPDSPYPPIATPPAGARCQRAGVPMPTAGSPRREAVHSPDRAFPALPHGFCRLALQVPSAQKGAVQTPRASRLRAMVAANILTPREAKTDAPDARWFLTQTPEGARVPSEQNQKHRWMRSLNVEAERDKLVRLRHVQQQAQTWPCDVCPALTREGSMMGSLKLLDAKQQSVEVQRLVQAEHMEVMTARAHAAANDTHEVVDTVESLMQLGLTELEASMEQFQRAERRLGNLRIHAVARPPDLNYHPEVTEANFGMLRDRYYYHRGKEMTELLKVIGVDRSDQTFANGGPVTNRQKKDPLQGLDFEFDVVGVPGSPVGFSVLKYRKTQDQPDQFQQENIAVFDSGYDADRPKV